jgi:hypothetical protein
VSIWERHAARRGPLDPAEKWELPYTESEGATYFRGPLEVFPHSPRRAEDIPGGAFDSLGEACGLEGLRQVFIVPWAVRSIGWEDRKVISPGSVLAIGTRAVGLWTEKPQPGVKVVILLAKLSAIEDVTILLYGRLAFLSSIDRLTIRYNTLARRALEPVLIELRKRLSGSARPIPRENQRAEDLPVKWKRLLRRDFVRLDERASVAFRFAKAPKSSRDDIERGQLLVLNPHELVYMCDPLESTHHFGEDSFIVPRSRITGIEVRKDGLEAASNGARVLLPMVPELCKAAAGWFA